MKVDGSLKSLMQGVSQQPARDRLTGQCSDQVNFTSDPISGLTRRPPTDMVNKLTTIGATPFFHTLQTKNGNRYLMTASDRVRVFDYNGVEQTVNNEAGSASYLTGGTLKFGTINNKTYITNQSVVASMLPDLSQYPNTNADGHMLLQILGGAYGKAYKVFIDGNMVANYQAPNGNDASQLPLVNPTYILNQIISQLSANINNFYMQTDNINTLYLVWAGHKFSASCSDDAGGVNMKVCTDFVTRTEDLPSRAIPNYMIRVASKSDPGMDVYYKFTADIPTATKPTPGYWQETVANGLKYKLDPASMPHVLEYLPDTNTFRYGVETWANRKVGTDTSNPQPSFIGDKILDISSFQSRLVFLSGPNVIMSRINHSTDFWMAATTVLADTDPVDISSTSVQGALRAAIPHNRDLVIFSSRGQFIVFGRTVLTPKNAALVLTTSFDAMLDAKPVTAGRNVFFCTDYGAFTGIREFYTEGSTDINDSRPVTHHVKKYIQGAAMHIAASSNYETLLVRSTGDPVSLYVYQYIWSDNQKVQSSWSRWQFPMVVRYMFFDEEVIYVILEENGNYYLTRMTLDQVDNENIGYQVFTDARFDVLGVHKSFAFPYDFYNNFEISVMQGEGCPNKGLPALIESSLYVPGTGWVITLQQDMQGGRVLVGTLFGSSYVPTQPFVKDSDGVPISGARLTLKNYVASVSMTGDIVGRVHTAWGDPQEIVFSGRIIGDGRNLVGRPALADEKFILPVRELAENCSAEFYTKSPYPLTILDLEWNGQYNKKGRRITVGGK